MRERVGHTILTGIRTQKWAWLLFLQPKYNSEPAKTPCGTIMATAGVTSPCGRQQRAKGADLHPTHSDVSQQSDHFMDLNSFVISNWSRILKAVWRHLDELSWSWTGITVYIQSGNLSHQNAKGSKKLTQGRRQPCCLYRLPVSSQTEAHPNPGLTLKLSPILHKPVQGLTTRNKTF